MGFSFDIAIGGLKAANEGLKVVSSNIANADTEGYKKRELVTSEMIPQKKDGFTYGSGVVIQEVKTVAAPYLFEKIIKNNELMAYNEGMMNKFDEIEKMIATDELSTKMQDFFSALDNLKNNPTLEGNKVLVVQETQQMLDLFDYNKDLLKTTQVEAKTTIKNQIKEINEIVNQFKDSIASQNYKKTDNNYVQDEMDRMIEKLSPYGEVDHYFKEEGTVVVRLNGINIYDTYDSREIEYNEQENKIIVGNNDMTTFFKKNGSIGAQLEIAGKQIGDMLEEYNILQTSLVYEVNDLFHESVVKNMNSDIEGSNVLNVSLNRQLMGLTEEELPTLVDTPLFDIPTLKGIQPGNMTITTYPEEKEFVININHKTTLNSLKNSIENYVVTGLEKDFDETTQTLYGVTKGEVIKNDFIDVSVSNGISIDSELPFSINDGETNLMSVFGMNNFITYSETNDRYNVNEKYENSPVKLFEYFDESQTTGMEKNKMIINDLVDLNFKSIDLNEDYLYKLSVANCPDMNYTEVNVKRIDTFSNGVNDFNFKISLQTAKYTEQFNSIEINNNFLNKQYNDVVGVDTDQQLTELMKLQAAYQANTKVINAMNELFDTLLRI